MQNSRLSVMNLRAVVPELFDEPATKPILPLSEQMVWDLGLLGWCAFTASAICYIMVSIGDHMYMMGACFYFGADILFLLSYLSVPRPPSPQKQGWRISQITSKDQRLKQQQALASHLQPYAQSNASASLKQSSVDEDRVAANSNAAADDRMKKQLSAIFEFDIDDEDVDSSARDSFENDSYDSSEETETTNQENNASAPAEAENEAATPLEQTTPQRPTLQRPTLQRPTLQRAVVDNRPNPVVVAQKLQQLSEILSTSSRNLMMNTNSNHGPSRRNSMLGTSNNNSSHHGGSTELHQEQQLEFQQQQKQAAQLLGALTRADSLRQLGALTRAASMKNLQSQPMSSRTSSMKDLKSRDDMMTQGQSPPGRFCPVSRAESIKDLLQSNSYHGKDMLGSSSTHSSNNVRVRSRSRASAIAQAHADSRIDQLNSSSHRSGSSHSQHGNNENPRICLGKTSAETMEHSAHRARTLIESDVQKLVETLDHDLSEEDNDDSQTNLPQQNYAKDKNSMTRSRSDESYFHNNNNNYHHQHHNNRSGTRLVRSDDDMSNNESFNNDNRRNHGSGRSLNFDGDQSFSNNRRNNGSGRSLSLDGDHDDDPRRAAAIAASIRNFQSDVRKSFAALKKSIIIGNNEIKDSGDDIENQQMQSYATREETVNVVTPVSSVNMRIDIEENEDDIEMQRTPKRQETPPQEVTTRNVTSHLTPSNNSVQQDQDDTTEASSTTKLERFAEQHWKEVLGLEGKISPSSIQVNNETKGRANKKLSNSAVKKIKSFLSGRAINRQKQYTRSKSVDDLLIRRKSVCPRTSARQRFNSIYDKAPTTTKLRRGRRKTGNRKGRATSDPNDWGNWEDIDWAELLNIPALLMGASSEGNSSQLDDKEESLNYNDLLNFESDEFCSTAKNTVTSTAAAAAAGGGGGTTSPMPTTGNRTSRNNSITVEQVFDKMNHSFPFHHHPSKSPRIFDTPRQQQRDSYDGSKSSSSLHVSSLALDLNNDDNGNNNSSRNGFSRRKSDPRKKRQNKKDGNRSLSSLHASSPSVDPNNDYDTSKNNNNRKGFPSVESDTRKTRENNVPEKHHDTIHSETSSSEQRASGKNSSTPSTGNRGGIFQSPITEFYASYSSNLHHNNNNNNNNHNFDGSLSTLSSARCWNSPQPQQQQRLRAPLSPNAKRLSTNAKRPPSQRSIMDPDGRNAESLNEESASSFWEDPEKQQQGKDLEAAMMQCHESFNSINDDASTSTSGKEDKAAKEIKLSDSVAKMAIPIELNFLHDENRDNENGLLGPTVLKSNDNNDELVDNSEFGASNSSFHSLPNFW